MNKKVKSMWVCSKKRKSVRERGMEKRNKNWYEEKKRKKETINNNTDRKRNKKMALKVKRRSIKRRNMWKNG